MSFNARSTAGMLPLAIKEPVSEVMYPNWREEFFLETATDVESDRDTRKKRQSNFMTSTQMHC